tara:strand:- start:266 stop:2638 length:2373 start_codon:yes stop_codon:yes gene_type:complete
MVLSELGAQSVAPAGRGSLQLANGQVGLFRMASKSANGALAVASLDGYGAKELFQLQVGTGRTQDAGGMTNKNFATIPFTREDILDVTVSTAKAPVYSSVTLGYNGTSGTGISLKENEATTVSLKLFGEQLSYLGFRDGVANMEFSIFSGAPDACDNCLNPCATTSCTSIVRDLVDNIRNYELRAGSDAGTGASIKVGDLVDVIGTYSCTPELVASSTTVKYNLTIEDEGTGEALASVASQYPDSTVERISREGITSVYQLLSGGGLPTAYAFPANTVTDDSGDEREIRILEECDTCPAGFTRIPASGDGFVYKIVVANDALSASDVESAINAMTAVSGATVTNAGRANGPIGTETMIAVLPVEVPLEGASGTGLVASVVAAAADAAELEISAVSPQDAVCVSNSDFTATTQAWVAGETCNLYQKTIQLDVDLDCGPFASATARTAAAAAKLAELQAIYSDLSVTLDAADIGECRARYNAVLTSEPVCDGCEVEEPIFPAMPDDYEFSAWAERTVGASEITSFTVADTTTVTIAADDVETVNEGTAAVTSKPAGSTFSFKVITSVAGSAVEDVVVQLDTANPSSGLAVGDTIVINLNTLNASNSGTITITITGIGGQFPDDCECGIKFVAKNAFLCPPAMLAEQIGTFTPKGVKIQVSGGEAPSVMQEGYQYVTTPFRVTRHERDFDGTGWGINYKNQERASAEYFAGISPRLSYAEGYLSGFETKLEPCLQYDKFTVKLRRNNYAGTASRRMAEEIRYVFLIPQGAQCLYQDFIEALGGATECPEVAGV